MKVKFSFHDGNFVKRDILVNDKVTDLKEILGVPEDTECNFFYAGYFIDTDSEGSDTLISRIIKNPSPYDFIFVSKGKIPPEYIKAKYNYSGMPPEGVKPIRIENISRQEMMFTKDDYNEYRKLYMDQISDYTILSHGVVETGEFIYVPKNITLIFKVELGSTIEGKALTGVANSIRTIRRQFSQETSSSSGSNKIRRIYKPGSIVLDHDLDLRGWWDPMGSGLIPKKVFEIVEGEGHIVRNLEDYNRDYPHRCIKEGSCDVSEGILQLNNTEFIRKGEGDEIREGEFWFNIYPLDGDRVNVKLGNILYWLSNFVGEENITVECSFCRPVDYEEMKKKMKECLIYDSQIFKGTFLEDFEEKGIDELTRESSFSSLELTRQAILSELERYKSLNISLPVIKGYDIEKLITLNTGSNVNDYIDFIILLLGDETQARIFDKQRAKELMDLFHIEKKVDKYILNGLPEDHEINRSLNDSRMFKERGRFNDKRILILLSKIENYYIQHLAKLTGDDINKLKLYTLYKYISNQDTLKMDPRAYFDDSGIIPSFQWKEFCHILLFMKLMRENQGVMPVSWSEPESEMSGSRDRARRRKKKRKTKRKKSKKNPKRKKSKKNPKRKSKRKRS